MMNIDETASRIEDIKNKINKGKELRQQAIVKRDMLREQLKEINEELKDLNIEPKNIENEILNIENEIEKSLKKIESELPLELLNNVDNLNNDDKTSNMEF